MYSNDEQREKMIQEILKRASPFDNYDENYRVSKECKISFLFDDIEISKSIAKHLFSTEEPEIILKILHEIRNIEHHNEIYFEMEEMKSSVIEIDESLNKIKQYMEEK